MDTVYRYREGYIEKAFRYIAQEIEQKSNPENINITDETLTKINNTFKLAGLIFLSDYSYFIKKIKDSYENKDVNYNVSIDIEFPNINFLELREK